jgi:hypothetical protein
MLMNAFMTVHDQFRSLLGVKAKSRLNLIERSGFSSSVLKACAPSNSPSETSV